MEASFSKTTRLVSLGIQMGSGHAITSKGVNTHLRNSMLEIYTVITPKAGGCFKKSGSKGTPGNEGQNEKLNTRMLPFQPVL